jgi:hypothetical protein
VSLEVRQRFGEPPARESKGLSNQVLPFDGLCGTMASKMNRYFATVAPLRPIVNVGAEP